ncbi:MAG: hypothetical protein F6K17_22770 [Okeania sp. SIO3C4]|nr:hypothetical protein [Okeania sp. SIO3B3]NER05212.1 hypothetical protein [Okeania sp. SIO3C4]
MNNLSIEITTATLGVRRVSTNYNQAITTFDSMNQTDVQTNKLGKGYILRGNTDMTIFSEDEESNLSKNSHNN